MFIIHSFTFNYIVGIDFSSKILGDMLGDFLHSLMGLGWMLGWPVSV